MQVAEKLFSDRRLHEVTLDDVARLASVGKGTIYACFRDKDDLFFQVATSGFDELCDLLARRVARDADFTTQLLQACDAITAFFRRRRHLFRMIQTEDARMSVARGRLHSRWLEKRRRLGEAVQMILRNGREAGLLRSDFSDEVLATFLLGLLRTRARNLENRDRPVSNALLVDFFLRGATGGVDAPSPEASSTGERHS